jgi:hypothetical protein
LLVVIGPSINADAVGRTFRVELLTVNNPKVSIALQNVDKGPVIIMLQFKVKLPLRVDGEFTTRLLFNVVTPPIVTVDPNVDIPSTLNPLLIVTLDLNVTF